MKPEVRRRRSYRGFFIEKKQNKMSKKIIRKSAKDSDKGRVMAKEILKKYPKTFKKLAHE